MLILHNNFNKEVMVGHLNSTYFATEPYDKETVFNAVKETLELCVESNDSESCDQELLAALFDDFDVGIGSIADVIVIPHYFTFTVKDVIYEFPIIIVEV